MEGTVMFPSSIGTGMSEKLKEKNFLEMSAMHGHSKEMQTFGDVSVFSSFLIATFGSIRQFFQLEEGHHRR